MQAALRGGFFSLTRSMSFTKPSAALPTAFRRGAACFALLMLVACSTPPTVPLAEQGWHAVPLPGKRATRYTQEVKAGRPALRALADRSASLMRRHWPLAADALGEVQFSWWVQAPLPGANLAEAGLGDSPARILFAFDGDHSRLSPKNRLMFDVAESLGGERPPYATLMYVFGNQPEHLGRTLVHTRTDRIRKIVLDAGPAHAGQWRDHRRNLADDFRQAFGEAPGPLLSVAFLTDADNTQQQAQAWYGPVQLGVRPD